MLQGIFAENGRAVVVVHLHRKGFPDMFPTLNCICICTKGWKLRWPGVKRSSFKHATFNITYGLPVTEIPHIPLFRKLSLYEARILNLNTEMHLWIVFTPSCASLMAAPREIIALSDSAALAEYLKTKGISLLSAEITLVSELPSRTISQRANALGNSVIDCSEKRR
ncbi:hypothetical protein AVEN_64192-1 [Araneus ventricosus]|uniref:Uncharacterized protein n=1 Tax=Araneus ventricosus TaxID=182803 RepID=A0A4Y2L4T1_ARAVE|nr:hypothetical protein AVEN_64192-1 [Araneus ventricosus]